MAQRYGVTVVGFLRGKRMNVYTCEERIADLSEAQSARQPDDELTARVRDAVIGGKLSCAAAHLISKETGASLARIGGACERAGVKIGQCQLGCF